VWRIPEVFGDDGDVDNGGVSFWWQEILERTRATRIDAGVVVTDGGQVRAPRILRCLEGYTRGYAGSGARGFP
jgi:hypothetical protein